MSDLKVQSGSVSVLQDILFKDRYQSVYAILDGASVPDLPKRLIKAKEDSMCLYRGKLEPELRATAPHLVKLRQDSPLTLWILEEGWGNHWGVFAITPIGLEALGRHLRGFLRVRGPDDEILYFRYYDPRVLPVFLPTCYAQELETIYGPISKFIVENEKGTQALVIDNDPRNLILKPIDLEDERAG